MRCEGNEDAAGIGGCVHIAESLEPIEDTGYEQGVLEHPEESNA